MKLASIAGALIALLVGARLSYAAGPTVIAVGALPGSGGDLAVNTKKPLENGAAGNLFGGIGSGLGHAGGDRFLATPDRGPNALTYDACVDNTTSYINRFHDLRLRLEANAGAGLPFVLKPSLEATTLLWSSTPLHYGTGLLCPVPPAGGPPSPLPDGAPRLNNAHTFYFTGRSDGFGGSDSLDPADARFDPESVRLARDGKSIFVTDEYGPYIYQFERESGQRIRVFTLPAKF